MSVFTNCLRTDVQTDGLQADRQKNRQANNGGYLCEKYIGYLEFRAALLGLELFFYWPITCY